MRSSAIVHAATCVALLSGATLLSAGAMQTPQRLGAPKPQPPPPAAAKVRITAATVPVMSKWVQAVRDHAPGKIDDAARWTLTMTVEDRQQFDAGLHLLLTAILRDPIVVKSEAEKAIADLGGMVPDAAAFLHRAVVLHSDAAIEDGPGAIVASTSPAEAVLAGALVAARDGSYLGVIEPNRHWKIARRILDYVKMTPAPDPFVGDWYHAVAAFMLRFSYFGELAPHLQHAEEVLPREARVQFDFGVLWENRGLPRAQQLLSDEKIRDQRFPPGRVRPTVRTSIDVPAPDVANRNAEARFRRALELDPSLVEARVRLARLLEVRGRHQDARAEAEGALYGTLGRTTAYYAHLFAGRAAAGARDLTSASRHFDAALALYPGAQSAQLARSQAALMRGDDLEAANVVDALSRTTRAGSLAEDPWWYYHMGAGRDARDLLAALWEGVRS